MTRVSRAAALRNYLKSDRPGLAPAVLYSRSSPAMVPATAGGHDMDPKHLETRLEGIRHLLSHLHGEVTNLEKSYTEVLRVLQRLEKVSSTDELTGLMRRAAFFTKYDELVHECALLGENVGILMIDIDHFKAVNDTHGHPTGDEVLKRVAELLKKYESPTCYTGRYGGEEFAVAVKGNDAEILGIAEMIRRGAERLHGPVLERDGTASSVVEWKCTLSVGMASARNEGFDAPRLLRAADAALYKAKRKGRNQVQAA